MKILSINIRGLKKEGKVAWARELISKTNPVITVLQETMCRKVSDRWIENILGSNSVRYAVKSSIGWSGGLVTIWDSNVFMFTQALEGKFFLAIRGSLVGYDSEIVTVNIYGPHNDEKKKRFWCSLGDLLQMTNVEGFFAEILTRFGPKPVRIFDSWLDEDVAENIIIEAWNKPVKSRQMDTIFRLKLKNVKDSLKSWSKQSFGKIDEELSKLRDESLYWENKAEARILDDQERSFECSKISEIDAGSLEKPFSEEEVWGAIKNYSATKAPGPDGFNFNFYKSFWWLIKDDLMKALHCYYKIIAKILSIRLKGVIEKVIGWEQSAYVKGWSILDSILIANELVEDVRKRKVKCCIFKADIEKAFDSVNWKFLMDT
ncbi:uncharacterized protein [Rutidosis leptorrhynchoides]|uniref:uncharacterized protein n=1 Tax=Rutidosis leptorrhynchoides TaxID=125765 RepID=UPI003A9A33D0